MTQEILQWRQNAQGKARSSKTRSLVSKACVVVLSQCKIITQWYFKLTSAGSGITCGPLEPQHYIEPPGIQLVVWPVCQTQGCSSSAGSLMWTRSSEARRRSCAKWAARTVKERGSKTARRSVPSNLICVVFNLHKQKMYKQQTQIPFLWADLGITLFSRIDTLFSRCLNPIWTFILIQLILVCILTIWSDTDIRKWRFSNHQSRFNS